MSDFFIYIFVFSMNLDLQRIITNSFIINDTRNNPNIDDISYFWNTYDIRPVQTPTTIYY
jgi:hypothetical protein